MAQDDQKQLRELNKRHHTHRSVLVMVLTAGTARRLSCSDMPLEQRPAISSLLVMMRFKLELKACELSFTHAQNEAARKEFEDSQRNVVGMLFGDNPSESDDDEQAGKKPRRDAARKKSMDWGTEDSMRENSKDPHNPSRSGEQQEEHTPMSVTMEDVIYEFRGVYGQSYTPHPMRVVPDSSR